MGRTRGTLVRVTSRDPRRGGEMTMCPCLLYLIFLFNLGMWDDEESLELRFYEGFDVDFGYGWPPSLCRFLSCYYF
ncbi:hypothetical protein Acr_00g0034160 [Actinidia rufa]|uniref:Transmembrane protein n=1 Tax=Actinidia rufa TaxID=165716 RepID=A0A7J0DG21_9ERIC|nr:hypothetical protein Acr_00g0034160 [Actinidia rufa]